MIDAIRAPVYDRDGQIILYDLYVGGEWIGSRRTSAQCDEAINSERRRIQHRATGERTFT